MTAHTTDSLHNDPPAHGANDAELVEEAPPGAPRWVKGFGIILVVLLLGFAGLHLTGNPPTHMPGSSDAQHGTQAP